MDGRTGVGHQFLQLGSKGGGGEGQEGRGGRGEEGEEEGRGRV